jgi:hypothetical protein
MLQIAFIRDQEKVIQALAKGIWTPKVLWKMS